MLIEQVLLNTDLSDTYSHVATTIVSHLRELHSFQSVIIIPDFYIREKAQVISDELLSAIIDELGVNVLLVVNCHSSDTKYSQLHWQSSIAHRNVTLLEVSNNAEYVPTPINGTTLMLPPSIKQYLTQGIILTVSKLRHKYSTTMLLRSLLPTNFDITITETYRIFNHIAFSLLDGVIEFPYSHESGTYFSKIYSSYFVKQYRGLLVFGRPLMVELVKREMLGEVYESILLQLYDELFPHVPFSSNMYIRRARWLGIQTM